jgi:hypothetical protein
MWSKPDNRTAGSTLEPLIIDFLEWLAQKPRPYHDVMDAWRTSCPRLTVWEDSVDAGYVVRMNVPGHEQMIDVTPAGLDILKLNGRRPGLSI